MGDAGGMLSKINTLETLVGKLIYGGKINVRQKLSE